MDLMVLQGITGAVVSRNWLSMANGANMAYTKAAFYEVEGFRGVDQLASGDDMLLMQKIREKYPESTGFLKSRKAIVRTSPAGSWNEFFHQRIRWASKARYYKDKKMLPVLLLVYLFNCCFLFLIAAAFTYRGYWNYVWIFWAAKTLVELPLFVSASLFFRRLRLLPFFILFQPFHIFYTIISGLFGQFGKYEWKGRRVE